MSQVLSEELLAYLSGEGGCGDCSGSFWALTGNSGTDSDVNFIGTTDNQDIVFKRDNIFSGLLNTQYENTSFGLGAMGNVGNNFSSANTGFGYGTLGALTTGQDNCAFGRGALSTNQTSNDNVAFGDMAGAYLVSGAFNTFIGDTNSLQSDGDFNVSVGALAGHQNEHEPNSTGDYNTSIGAKSAQSLTDGSNNIFVGAFAGTYNTTESNRIFVNSLDRTNYTGDKTESPIYIEEDVVVSNQKVFINALLNITYVPVYADNSAAITGGLVIGAIYRTGDSLKIVH